MSRDELPESILKAITRYGAQRGYDITTRNELEDLIAAEGAKANHIVSTYNREISRLQHEVTKLQALAKEVDTYRAVLRRVAAVEACKCDEYPHSSECVIAAAEESLKSVATA